MKKIKRLAQTICAIAAATMIALPVSAQDTGSSATMRRGSRDKKKDETPGVTTRMQHRMTTEPTSDADLAWMKVIYRSLDLNKDENAPLYFPEQPVDGNESLFRIIMRLLASGQIAAYEYNDGGEDFSDNAKVKVRDVLDRYNIYYKEGRGSNERHPKFEIEAVDVPATEVLSYYIIERWEFDTRTNRMRSRVEAICPVLHRDDDYGMSALKYPMFWVKYDDLRPYLSTQNIFISDANNRPSCTYDDYFQLGLYDGEIYKTRNLRNRSMRQLYPNPDDLARAQDSIQRQLDTFEDKLWVPSLEELEAERERLAALEAAAAEGDSTAVAAPAEKPKGRSSTTRRGTPQKDKKPAVKAKRGKSKGPKTKESKATTAPRRSVRDRKR